MTGLIISSTYRLSGSERLELSARSLRKETAHALLSDLRGLELWGKSHDDHAKAEVMAALAYHDPASLESLEQILDLSSSNAVGTLEQSAGEIDILNAGFLSLARGDIEHGYRLFERSNHPDALRITAGKLFDRYQELSDEHSSEKTSIRVQAINTAKKYLALHPDDHSMNYCVGMLLHANRIEHAARPYLVKALDIEDAGLDIEALTALEDIDLSRSKARESLNRELSLLDWSSWKTLLEDTNLGTVLSDDEVSICAAAFLDAHPEYTPEFINCLGTKPTQRVKAMGKHIAITLSAAALTHCNPEDIKKLMKASSLNAEEERELAVRFITTFSTTTFNQAQIDFFMSQFDKIVGKKYEYAASGLMGILQGQVRDITERHKPSASELVGSTYYKHIRKYALGNASAHQFHDLFFELCSCGLTKVDTPQALEAIMSDLDKLSSQQSRTNEEVAQPLLKAAEWYASHISKQRGNSSLEKAIAYYQRVVGYDPDQIPALYTLITSHKASINNNSRLRAELASTYVNFSLQNPSSSRLLTALDIFSEYLSDHSVKESIAGKRIGMHLGAILECLDKQGYHPETSSEQKLVALGTKLAALDEASREKKADLSGHIKRLAQVQYLELIDLALRLEGSGSYPEALEALLAVEECIDHEMRIPLEERICKFDTTKSEAHKAHCLWRQGIVMARQCLKSNTYKDLNLIEQRLNRSETLLERYNKLAQSKSLQIDHASNGDVAVLYEVIKYVLNRTYNELQQQECYKGLLKIFTNAYSRSEQRYPHMDQTMTESLCILASMGDVESLEAFSQQHPKFLHRIIKRCLNTRKPSPAKEEATELFLSSTDMHRIAEIGLGHKSADRTTDSSVICMLLNQCEHGNNADIIKLLTLSRKHGYAESLSAQRENNAIETIVTLQEIDKAYAYITAVCTSRADSSHPIDEEILKEALIIQSHMNLEKIHHLLSVDATTDITLFDDLPKKLHLLDVTFPETPAIKRLHAYTLWVFSAILRQNNDPRFMEYLTRAQTCAQELPNDPILKKTLERCTHHLLVHKYKLATTQHEKKGFLKLILEELDKSSEPELYLLQEAYKFLFTIGEVNEAKRFIQKAVTLGDAAGKDILEAFKKGQKVSVMLLPK